MKNKNPYDEQPLKLFHPVYTYKMKFIKSFEAIDLHHNIYENGKLVYQIPTEDESRDYLAQGLQSFGMKTSVFLNPQEYPVDLGKSMLG